MTRRISAVTSADVPPQEPDLFIEQLLSDPRRMTEAQRDEAAKTLGWTRTMVDAYLADKLKRWLSGLDPDMVAALELDKGPVTDETLARLRRVE